MHVAISMYTHSPLHICPDTARAYPKLQLQTNDPLVFVHISSHGPIPPFGRHSLMSTLYYFYNIIYMYNTVSYSILNPCIYGTIMLQ